MQMLAVLLEALDHHLSSRLDDIEKKIDNLGSIRGGGQGGSEAAGGQQRIELLLTAQIDKLRHLEDMHDATRQDIIL